MTRRGVPPLRTCAECGRNVGRAWAEYQLCQKCGQLSIDEVKCRCDREKSKHNPDCPVHVHDPYDIPF